MPEVKNVKTETGSVHEALGITKERADVLLVHLQSAHDSSTTYTEAIAAASKFTETNEELAYISFNVGVAYSEIARQKEMLGKLHELFGE